MCREKETLVERKRRERDKNSLLSRLEQLLSLRASSPGVERTRVWMAERKKESPAGTMGRKALAAAPSWRGLLLFSRLEAGDGIPKNIVVAGAGGVKAPGEEGRGFPEEEEDEAVGTIEAAGAIAAIALRSLKVGPAPPRPALSSLCPSPLSSYSHVKQLLVAGERGGYKVTVAVHWGHWR